MKNFLYLCLFGTALAGGVARAQVADVSALTAQNIAAGMDYGSAMDAANAAVSSVATNATTAASSVADVSALTAQNIAAGMDYSAAVDAANAAVNGGAEAAASALGQPAASSGGLWSTIGEGISNGVSGLKNAVTGGVNWATDGLKSVWNAGVDKVTGLFSSGAETGAKAATETTTKAAEKLAENATKAGEKAGEATAEAASAVAPDKAVVFNVIQYAIVILQALEGTEQEDITKEVNVKAQELQDSQGSSTPSTITEATSTPDVSMEATTLSAAANAMIALLQNNPIYPDLLSEESCLLTGTTAGSGSASGDSTQDVRETDNYIECMQKKRLIFANTTALSAQVIAEGSNAISHEFYDRVSALATAAKSTTGTLGSMSVVNDSERFPYFEMVRGSALSAIQLELKAAETLSELTGEMEEVKNAQ